MRILHALYGFCSLLYESFSWTTSPSPVKANANRTYALQSSRGCGYQNPRGSRVPCKTEPVATEFRRQYQARTSFPSKSQFLNAYGTVECPTWLLMSVGNISLIRGMNTTVRKVPFCSPSRILYFSRPACPLNTPCKMRTQQRRSHSSVESVRHAHGSCFCCFGCNDLIGTLLVGNLLMAGAALY